MTNEKMKLERYQKPELERNPIRNGFFFETCGTNRISEFNRWKFSSFIDQEKNSPNRNVLHRERAK